MGNDYQHKSRGTRGDPGQHESIADNVEITFKFRSNVKAANELADTIERLLDARSRSHVAVDVFDSTNKQAAS